MEKQLDITSSKVASSFEHKVLGSSTQMEALDSFTQVEPPPLDWRSESSSEVGSLQDIEEAGSFSMATPIGELTDCGACNRSCTPIKGENRTEQEAGKLPKQEVPDITNQEVEAQANRTRRMDKLEDLEMMRLKPTESHHQHDVDHAHIQDLLNQLQLFHPTPSKDPEPEAEMSTFSIDRATELLSSSCLVPDLCAYPKLSDESPASGLLFTVSNQKALLELLEDPEPHELQTFQEAQEDQPICTEHATESHIESNTVQLPDCHTRYITRHGEIDEMVSVSYGSDVWHSPFQDEFMMSGYSEDEGMEQWRHPRRAVSDESASPGADVDAEAEAQASYKDVPGPCDPEDLLDGVIFGSKYLGSTQLLTDRNPSTNARMTQAQEAVDRIKAPEGESQPMTEVDLFISTQRIKVLSADTQEAMMDHPLQMISYIADIENLVVLMVRRKPAEHKSADSAACSSSLPKKCWMICHVFSSEDAQIIAQAIGQAFGVAYQKFLQANGINGGEFRGEYCLGSQELYNGDLVHFSQSENIREVFIIKKVGEILGIAVVESGWGSILPTVVVANMLHGGAAERSGELSIGDRIMSVNGVSLVGLPITTCHNIIRHDCATLRKTPELREDTVFCSLESHDLSVLHKSCDLNPTERLWDKLEDQLHLVHLTKFIQVPTALCHKDLKNQSQLKLSIVHCPPVTMAIIKRPNPKYQLGFSVEDGIICSLMRGGIAERGGIRVGHRIIEINGQSVVATPHEKIIHILTNAVGEIHLKTMPTSTYRLLTGQEQPLYL